jgi:hypothetical protein
MPPRVQIPADDLYARLGVPVDASLEAIEIAWRGLLRKHHPDVAGADALDLAKRINVAHDWLSDPDLRRRYDAERGVGNKQRAPAGIRGDRRPRPTAPGRPRPVTTAERVAAVVERVGRLTDDELDRLARAEPAPIAFLATLRRFVTPELQATLDAAEAAVVAALPAPSRRRPAIRDAIVGRVATIVLGDALDDLLGASGGDRARERLSRGWDAAVGQPRYGPATLAVETLLAELRGLDEVERRWLAGTGARDELGEDPWPDGTSAEEDEVLRVSTALAAGDAEAAVDQGGRAGPVAAGARRASARVAHLLVLRHAFAPRTFERHARPWLGRLIPVASAPTRVRARR